MSISDQSQSNAEQSSAKPNENSVLIPTDTQVKSKRPYAPRRRFDAGYKQRILAAYSACDSTAERGVLLRREGLYHARIAAWRKELAKGKLNTDKQKPAKVRTDHLVRQNERLKKQLAQAKVIIELQKKVADLLGVILPQHENIDLD